MPRRSPFTVEDLLEFGGRGFPKRSTVAYHLGRFVAAGLLTQDGRRGVLSKYQMTDNGRRHLAALA